jgi:hypothetical protein
MEAACSNENLLINYIWNEVMTQGEMAVAGLVRSSTPCETVSLSADSNFQIAAIQCNLT